MVERIYIGYTTRDKVEATLASHRGIPSAYDPKTFPRTAKFLAQRGATQAEIADCFQVTTRTLQHWLTLHPELQEAITTGNEAFDPRVERALAERALGYTVDVEECYVIDKELVTHKTRKHYPPDVTACIFWLKNRQPEKWRDVQRHEITTGLKSSDELREALLVEFKDLVDQGLLALPGPGRKMKEINPKGSR